MMMMITDAGRGQIATTTHVFQWRRAAPKLNGEIAVSSMLEETLILNEDSTADCAQRLVVFKSAAALAEVQVDSLSLSNR